MSSCCFRCFCSPRKSLLFRFYWSSVTYSEICVQFDARQEMALSLDVYLQGNATTENDIVRHLETLADSYSRHWIYNRDRRDEMFVTLRYRLPLSATLFGSNCGGKVEIWVNGSLAGCSADGSEVAGFNVSVMSDVAFEDDNRFTHFDFTQYYPCSHIPVPPEWDADR